MVRKSSDKLLSELIDAMLKEKMENGIAKEVSKFIDDRIKESYKAIDLDKQVKTRVNKALDDLEKQVKASTMSVAADKYGNKLIDEIRRLKAEIQEIAKSS